MEGYRNPNAVERCMRCKALFGTPFAQERVVYDNGKFVVCNDCSHQIETNNNPMFCIHCRVRLDVGKVGVSQQVRGVWYCDVCLQEMKERESPFGDPYYKLIDVYNNIRRVRDQGGNYKQMLIARRERCNEARLEDARSRGGRYA